MNLTTLYVWRGVTTSYFPLESVLTTLDMADEAIICADPTSKDETMELAYAIAKKYPQVRVIEHVWDTTSKMGSAIGEASNFALKHVETDLVCNVQADEVWYPELTQWVKENKNDLDRFSLFRFRFLHTRYNAQQWQENAGYVRADKMATVSLPELRFARDAWGFEYEGAGAVMGIGESEKYPIVHLHHFFKEGVVQQLQNNKVIFGDPNSFKEYDDVVGNVEFMSSPIWESRTSPFRLPECVIPHLGESRYHINWRMLE